MEGQYWLRKTGCQLQFNRNQLIPMGPQPQCASQSKSGWGRLGPPGLPRAFPCALAARATAMQAKTLTLPAMHRNRARAPIYARAHDQFNGQTQHVSARRRLVGVCRLVMHTFVVLVIHGNEPGGTGTFPAGHGPCTAVSGETSKTKPVVGVALALRTASPRYYSEALMHLEFVRGAVVVAILIEKNWVSTANPHEQAASILR